MSSCIPSPDRGTRAERIFHCITARPRLVIAVGLAALTMMASGLPRLVKDTTADAFIAADNPAVVYRDKVKRVFGLDDPFVVAVIATDGGNVYEPERLELVRQLTAAVSRQDNIDPDRVTSLATENNITGTHDGMEVTAFYELGDGVTPDGAAIARAIDDFPLYQGSLTARDGTGTLIVAEIIDDALGQQTYDDLLALVDGISLPQGVAVHVAGEAAVSGYLGTYIDRDATRLNPLSALAITFVLVLAFRTIAGGFLPNVIVAATAAGSLGVMGLAGVSFFVITNGLLPILIGIAVADSIHILSEYYALAARFPDAGRRQHVVAAMTRMWRPITLTTVTTMAGFIGLWLGAEMPPMKYFGAFAALGVAVAWLYSLTFLPAALAVLPLTPSAAFDRTTPDRFAASMGRFGALVMAHPGAVLGTLAIVAVVGAVGASRLVVEEAQIENFQKDEPIYLADTALNSRFDGTNYLDVVVETKAREGLFEPEVLRRIEALQAFGETLPGVQGSTSVADYIRQMHKAVNENAVEADVIPDDPFLIAQLFLLYSTSGDPTDFEEEIDYDYQRANVRFNLNTSFYRNNRNVIAAFERYIAEDFVDEDVSANLSGRVFVNHHWLNTIGDNHFRSLAISLALVWLMASAVFRSFAAGVFALVPVVLSILLIYAVMGFSGIWLGVGTSMFAAIAIGLGIDFAIHTIDRMRELAGDGDAESDLATRLAPLFPTTGRALFFNFFAIGLGFLVLTTSEVPPLIKFGALVAVAVAASFIGSMALMPTLAVRLKPAFMVRPATTKNRDARGRAVATSSIVALVMLIGVLAWGGEARADDEVDAGIRVMQAVVDRDEGEWVTRRLRMRMTDRNGIERERDTLSYRRYFGDEKRTVIFYTAPANVRDTGFLTYDYPETDRDDDQWLYLPALRKVRRISASDRGDYFLGTDFSYEDIKKENKIAMEDYRLRRIGADDIDGHAVSVIEGVPVNDAVAAELGYGRVRWYVDETIDIARKTEIWDVNGNPLKTLTTSRISEIAGIWTVERIEVANHKTGHRTEFEFYDIDYNSEVAERVFRTAALRRGAR